MSSAASEDPDLFLAVKEVIRRQGFRYSEQLDDSIEDLVEAVLNHEEEHLDELDTEEDDA